MKKILAAAALAPALFALAACGSADDANAPAEVDTVEMPADEVMATEGMDADPAVDPALIEAEEAAAAEEIAEAAEASADYAEDAAADLEAAMAEE